MDQASMLAVLRHYFSEELKESWVFVLVGLLAVAVGVWLWKSQSAFKHALWPLAAVAVIQVVAGGTIVLRTPAQTAALEAQLAADPPAFKAAETGRVLRVMDAFRFYKLAEIACILVAIGLALFLPHNDIARGVALGLLLQASLGLAADLVAEHRAQVYLEAIARL
jgi:hypothetical protein